MEGKTVVDERPPRFRMFAGPNGSGKSTLKSQLRPEWLGVYLNPDEIQRKLEQSEVLDFGAFGVEISEAAVLESLTGSELLIGRDLLGALSKFSVNGNLFSAPRGCFGAYHASALCSFLREELIKSGLDFTIETVMSSPDKVILFERTRTAGYRNYLYFIATESPLINISRVRGRVAGGGHDVPESKIVSRYYRSLGLLRDAIRHTDRTYIFDNSREDEENLWVAEITGGVEIEGRSEFVPGWFSEYVCRI